MSYEQSNDSMHAVGTFFTFACGAVAGAAVALMFAPTTGRDTRAFLAQRSRRAAEKGRELVNEHGAVVSEAIERGRDRVSTFGERIGQAVEQGRAGYRDAIRQGQGLVDDAMRNAEDTARAAQGAARHLTD